MHHIVKKTKQNQAPAEDLDLIVDGSNENVQGLMQVFLQDTGMPQQKQREPRSRAAKAQSLERIQTGRDSSQ